MKFVLKPADTVVLPIQGEEGYFPVHRVYCVGRNYAAHAKEIGVNPDREPPFFFCKPSDALVYAENGVGQFVYPSATHLVHHEVELVVALGQAGSQIPVTQALEHVFGYAVGLDMTRRDLQTQAKQKGHPWDVAKGFDGSAPIGQIYPVKSNGHVLQGSLALSVNGQLRQQGLLQEMIWSVAETISYLSSLFALKAGDLIFTGTPEGVGPVEKGDVIEAQIAHLQRITFHVV